MIKLEQAQRKVEAYLNKNYPALRHNRVLAYHMAVLLKAGSVDPKAAFIDAINHNIK